MQEAVNGDPWKDVYGSYRNSPERKNQYEDTQHAGSLGTLCPTIFLNHRGPLESQDLACRKEDKENRVISLPSPTKGLIEIRAEGARVLN